MYIRFHTCLLITIAVINMLCFFLQALCDTLEDLIPRAPTASQPSPTVLRGVYSLLAEGGVYFPSLVVDTEPAHVWRNKTLKCLEINLKLSQPLSETTAETYNEM